MGRKLYIPIDVSYSEYMGDSLVRSESQKQYLKEIEDFMSSGSAVCEMGTFLYLLEKLDTMLNNITMKDIDRDNVIEKATEFLGSALQSGKLHLTEGQAVSLGITIGRYIFLCETLEKFEDVANRLFPKGGNE